MRLSSLVVATCFLLSTVLLAQHRTESSSSDSRSSSSSSSTSSSSSSPSYSGSSSSSSSSSSSHSSGGGYDSSSHSSPSHSSGSSGSDTYHGSTSTHTPNDSRSSHAGSEPSSRGNDRNVRNSDARQDSSRSNVATTGTTAPRTTRADNNRTVRDPKHDRTPVATDRQLKTDAKPEREKRHFFLFWRHPKRDPESDLKPKPLPPKRCKKGEDCPVTPGTGRQDTTPQAMQGGRGVPGVFEWILPGRFGQVRARGSVPARWALEWQHLRGPAELRSRPVLESHDQPLRRHLYYLHGR